MASSTGTLQLLAEHPTWTWAQAQGLGSKSSWTTLLQKDGFSAGDITDFLGGKLTAAQLIAKHPATGMGNNSGIGTAASQAADAAAGAIPGVSGLAAIATFLTSTSNWVRIGEVIAGLVLLAMGLRTLAGRDTTPISVTTSATKTAAKAALA